MYLKIHNINTTVIFQQFNKYYTINMYKIHTTDTLNLSFQPSGR